MLQRVLAALLCLLGAAAIGLAVASATVWRSSDTLTASATAAPGSTLMMTAPGVLDLADEEVTVRAEGEDVVIALGTTRDVEAWVGQDPHTVVTGLSDLTTLSTTDVSAAGADPEDAATEGEDAEDPAAAPPPNPVDSDLWVQTVTDEATAELPLRAEEGRWSVLVASTAEGAGPPALTLVWPQEVTTPWLVPGVAVGSVLLLAGAVWLAVLIVRGRRARRRERLAARDHGGPIPVGASPDVPVRTSAPAGAPGATQPPGGAPSTGPARTDRPAGAPGADAVPGAPLTRRQRRELERTGQIPTVGAEGAPSATEQPPRATVPGPTATDPGPTVAGVPDGARRVPAPTAAEETPGRHGRRAAGAALGAGIVPAAPGRPPSTAEGSPAAPEGPPAAPDGRPESPPAPPEAPQAPSADRPTSDETVAGSAFRSRLTARFRRRPEPGDAPSDTAAAQLPEPPAVDPPAEPVWTPRTGQHGPNASADAWRRAWGFAPPTAGGETVQDAEGPATGRDRDAPATDGGPEGGAR